MSSECRAISTWRQDSSMTMTELFMAREYFSRGLFKEGFDIMVHSRLGIRRLVVSTPLKSRDYWFMTCSNLPVTDQRPVIINWKTFAISGPERNNYESK